MVAIKNIIVQAGGLGSRLETLTRNKPKALVAVENLPLVFHTFKLFPEARFKIIADYKADVLQKYLDIFADVDFEIIIAKEKGTASGMAEAIADFGDDEPFMISWCDLILPENLRIDDVSKNYMGISKDFECRWSYRGGQCVKEPSKEDGIAGLFVFKNKAEIADVPSSGAFVRWLATRDIEFERLDLTGGREVGTLLAYRETVSNEPSCRPFNSLSFDGDKVTKVPVTDQGRDIAVKEKGWYQFVRAKGFSAIPEIFSYDPLVLSRVDGQNIFKYDLLSQDQKEGILDKILAQLGALNELADPVPADFEDYIGNSFDKTFDRLSTVQSLIPFAGDEFIRINGAYYRNPFFMKDEIERALEAHAPSAFYVIHGDTTFSNILLEREGVDPVFIDPRGYYGKSLIYGDKDYDLVKLYYSIAGNYDQFNMKKFSLDISDREVRFEIRSNGWEDVADYFKRRSDIAEEKLLLMHAMIWLSLTTYAWEDYDSICAAFYKGVVELDKILY